MGDLVWPMLGFNLYLTTCWPRGVEGGDAVKLTKYLFHPGHE